MLAERNKANFRLRRAAVDIYKKLWASLVARNNIKTLNMELVFNDEEYI